MAREPLRKEVDRTFRCVEEDLLFPGKMELVGHEVEEPGGGIMWKETPAQAA
jgi:hypothetical protein